MKIDKIQLRKEQAIQTIFTSFFNSVFFTADSITIETIDSMMSDSDIKSAIDSIKMAVHNRIISMTNIKPDELVKWNKIIDYDVIDEIIDSRFYGYSVQEIMYNDSYFISSIKNKPRAWFKPIWNDTEKMWKWTYGLLGSNKELPDAKFLISVHKAMDNKPMGVSELVPIYQYWKIKSDALTYATDLVKKYGGVITWFIYNEDTPIEELQDMVDGLTNLQGSDVIPIPTKPNGVQQGLGKEFGFISMSDLTSDIHQQLINFCKNQITEYIIGNSLIQRQGSTGSYASTQTANEIREEYVAAYSVYVAKNLNILLDYENAIHGIIYNDVSFLLQKPDNVVEIEDVKNKKLQNYKLLKEVGYTLTAAYISTELNIPENVLIPYIEPSPLAQFERAAVKKKDLFRINADKFWEQMLKVEGVIKEISDVYREQFDRIKTEADIISISANLSNTRFDELITLATLRGMFDVNEENIKSAEFAEDDFSFDMKFSEAISYFSSKQPELFTNIDAINKQVTDKMFWIKKSTDLQATTKMQKALTKTLQSGGTFKQWRDDIQGEADKLGFGKDGYYLKNVFRTNMLTAYNSGRQEQQIKNAEFTPYWQYDAIEDGRTSDICSTLNGKIYKANDPIWDKIYPPNHFQCRSGVIALDKDEFEEAKGDGYQLESSSSEQTKNVLRLLADSGFDASPNNQAEAIVMMDINGKTYDIAVKAIAAGEITNTQRRALLKELMEDMHPDSGAGQKMIASKGANGSAVTSYNAFLGREVVHHIELNSKDTRPVEYKLTTIFHEITHFRKHGTEGWAEYDHGIGNTDKHRLEEVMADMTSIYLTKKYTNIQTIPAYTEEISNAMAYLKRTKDFANAKTVEDIGEVFYNKYYLTKKSLIPLSKEIEDMRNADYKKLTDEEMQAAGSTLFKYKLKEDAGFVVYQDSLRKRFEDPEHKAAVVKLVARKYNATETSILLDINSGKSRNWNLYEVASMIVGGI